MFARRKPGNLADKLLVANESAESKVDRLFLSVLQRLPGDKERAAFAAHLGRGAKPEAAVEDVIWVLLNGSEFRFNH